MRIDGDQVHIRVKVGIQRTDVSPVLTILLVHVLEIERVYIRVADQIRDDVAAEVVARIFRGVVQKRLDQDRSPKNVNTHRSQNKVWIRWYRLRIFRLFLKSDDPLVAIDLQNT